MTDEQINIMVERFLSWRLPEDFQPDAGISFKPAFNENSAHPMRHEPTGTNLFNAMQAEAMVRHIAAGLEGDGNFEPAQDGPMALISRSRLSLATEVIKLRQTRLAQTPPEDVRDLVARVSDMANGSQLTVVYRERMGAALPLQFRNDLLSILALTAASRQVVVPEGWQPIETAPKDGRWFIADQDGDLYPCQWHREEPDEGPPHEGWFDLFNQSFEEPQRWFPLPAAAPHPPVSSGEG